MSDRSTSDQWHWDTDRHRWVYMGADASSNPTYRWELSAGAWVYSNPLMMQAIDVACQNMQTFPDADAIIKQLNNKEV